MLFKRLLMSTTITNHNTKKDALKVLIGMNPLIPLGTIMLIKYINRINIKINWLWCRIYKRCYKRHNKEYRQYVYNRYGYEL